MRELMVDQQSKKAFGVDDRSAHLPEETGQAHRDSPPPAQRELERKRGTGLNWEHCGADYCPGLPNRAGSSQVMEHLAISQGSSAEPGMGLNDSDVQGGPVYDDLLVGEAYAE